MNNEPHVQPDSPTPDSMPIPASVKSADAHGRRRLLLKGLSKGSAVAAVVVPINTLASPTLMRLCTVSGMQSNVGSGRTGITTEQCKGYSPTYYGNKKNWPNFSGSGEDAKGNTYYSVDGIKFSAKTKFKTVFGSSSLGDEELIEICKERSTSDEAVWIAALLNAIKNPPGFFFPYTPSQVRTYYMSADGPVRANALKLFRDYLQTVNG